MKAIIWLAGAAVLGAATVASGYVDSVELKKQSDLRDALAISNDSRLYVTSEPVKDARGATSEFVLSVRDAKSGMVVRPLEWKRAEWGQPISAVFSPSDLKLLVFHLIQSKSGGKVFDLSTGEMVFNVRHDVLRTAVFSPDSKGILSSGDPIEGAGRNGQGALRASLWLWNIGTRKKIAMHSSIEGAFGGGHPSKAIVISPNGKLVAAADFGPRPVVYVCSATSGERVCELNGHTKDISAVAFSPDSKVVASGDRDGVVRLWSVPSGKPIGDYDDHQAAIVALSFDPKHKLLASSGDDRTIKLFDLLKRKVVSTTGLEKSDTRLRIKFSSRGDTLVATPDAEFPRGKGLTIWTVQLQK